ncbi:pyridoxal phosphate-dependent aminotransferase [Puniceibacterium sp. IMCC21224]|uniref:pyridoxal phosphate-dependent aminotransferase n=1 Tax=Puniceibacterium sp. IMCC21224 TaxID=1618204 RepID=UPI00064DC1BE|nr:pyridoxal phosphate-dependent aminotransferase [Puniceibacterium sp. IMCC21224]KMK69044.1 aspartate/tyrosine/aromatic aminotransferase [Puniceibacterium sp. IMCC21224]
MTKISTRLGRIAPSPSIAAMSHARGLIAKGRDICDLTAGEPDFDTPKHILQAAAEAMSAGATRYTPPGGTAALKQAIVEKFFRENRLKVRPDEVIVGAGAKQVIFNAMAATLEPGDEVVVVAPYWVSYPDIALYHGAKPVVVETFASDGYRIDPDRLRRALTPRTRWLMLNSPNNPTGTMIDIETMQQIGGVLRDHPSVMVMTDEIYEHIRFTDRAAGSFAAVNPDLADRVLTVNGVSKTYAMTGFRIGYAAGPSDLVAAMAKLQSQNSGNPAAVSQEAARAALTSGLDFLPQWVDAYRARKNLVVQRLSSVPGLSVFEPQGAFYVYVGCSEWIGCAGPSGRVLSDDSAVVMELLDHGVASVQGSAYGVSPAFRLSIASGIDVLAAACDRLADFAGRLKQ